MLALMTCAFCVMSCNKDDEEIDLFPAGTSSLRMMNEDNGKTLLGNSDVYITKEGNFASDRFPLFDMGEKNGIGDIGMPDFINMAPKVAVQLKHGYVICSDDKVHTFASKRKAIARDEMVYRVFVDSWIQDKDGNAVGANVRFLLGTPLSEEGALPAWGINIGSLSWNYEQNANSNSIRVPLSSNDAEVEFITQHADEYIAYTVDRNTLSFTLKNEWWPGGDYQLRIRSGQVYTEVTVTLRQY